MAIVDLPSYKMVMFHSYVRLPEGIYSTDSFPIGSGKWFWAVEDQFTIFNHWSWTERIVWKGLSPSKLRVFSSYSQWSISLPACLNNVSEWVCLWPDLYEKIECQWTLRSVEEIWNHPAVWVFHFSDTADGCGVNHLPIKMKFNLDQVKHGWT